MNYVRILVEGGRPILRIVILEPHLVKDIELNGSRIFSLMSDGFAALLTMAQSGTFVGLIQEEKSDDEAPKV